MSKISFNTDNRPERFFETAQDAWMWFCFCETTPKAKQSSCSEFSYPCEPSDIAIIIKRLFMQKKISKAQLDILEKYGIKQMPPHENYGDSKRICLLWKQALERILEPLRTKGIIGLLGKAFVF